MKQLHQHLLNILIHNFYHKPFQMNEDIESIENSLISNDLDSTIYIVHLTLITCFFLLNHRGCVCIQTLYHTYTHKCVSLKHTSDITMMPLPHL